MLNRRTRVAHIITRLELGGAQQNTLYTVSHLNPEEFESHLICGAGGILDADAAAMTGVKTHFTPLVREIRPLQDAKSYRHLKQLLKSIQPDIVHTHSSKAGVIGRAAARKAGVPVVVHTYHGFGFHRFQKPPIFRAYVIAEKMAAKYADHHVFVSNDNIRYARETGILHDDRYSLIRSGVEVRKIREAKRHKGAFRKRLGIPENVPLIGMVACLKPQKDPLTFVRAMNLVKKQIPEAQFVLAGDGELRNQVESEIRSLQIADKFHLTGWIRNVEELLCDLDVVVLTSLWEGLPRVLVEAAIAGVPVVASDVDGNREIVQSPAAGALAQPGNPETFADGVVKLLSNQMMVSAEYSEKIADEFDIDRMVRSQEELYRKLLSK